jgi:hypothetical protein
MAKRAKKDQAVTASKALPAGSAEALKYLPKDDAAAAQKARTFIYGKNVVCETDSIGHATPENRDIRELVVNASEGFVPLWAKGVTLRWRFQETSMLAFKEPEQAKTYLRGLFGEGVLLWGDAVPVRFTEVFDAWDFEIVVKNVPNCSINGCTLARGFFPDAGQHELVLFPTLFEQPYKEQIETLAHELGHVFGLRHFFALVSETDSPSEVFGKHDRFTIMNYGTDSKMTAADQTDLKLLYRDVWSGALSDINGTPIRLVDPFSAMRMLPAPPAAIAFR